MGEQGSDVSNAADEKMSDGDGQGAGAGSGDGSGDDAASGVCAAEGGATSSAAGTGAGARARDGLLLPSASMCSLMWRICLLMDGEAGCALDDASGVTGALAAATAAAAAAAAVLAAADAGTKGDRRAADMGERCSAAGGRRAITGMATDTATGAMEAEAEEEEEEGEAEEATMGRAAAVAEAEAEAADRVATSSNPAAALALIAGRWWMTRRGDWDGYGQANGSSSSGSPVPDIVSLRSPLAALRLVDVCIASLSHLHSDTGLQRYQQHSKRGVDCTAGSARVCSALLCVSVGTTKAVTERVRREQWAEQWGTPRCDQRKERSAICKEGGNTAAQTTTRGGALARLHQHDEQRAELRAAEV